MSAVAGVWGPRWARWYRRALPAYWIFLFLVTHLPDLRLGVDVPGKDKTAHVVAYGLLAFLFWRFAEAVRGRPLSSRFAPLAAFWLLAYAALDEYLQGFVGRSCDLVDFLADAAGIVLVLGFLEWRRRVRSEHQRGDP